MAVSMDRIVRVLLLVTYINRLIFNTVIEKPSAELLEYIF